MLAEAGREELSPIFQQLKIVQASGFPPAYLTRRITDRAGNAVANIFRDGEVTGYLDLLSQVSSAMGLEDPRRSQPTILELDDTWRAMPDTSDRRMIAAVIYRIEDGILQQVAARIFDGLTKKQRDAFDAEMAVKVRDFDTGEKSKLVGAGGLLVLGNMGGFATYTTMSSLLHLVSAGSFGFGVYTTASSVLSVLLGPAGWASLAGYALFRAGAPKLQVLAPIAVCISLVRIRRAAT